MIWNYDLNPIWEGKEFIHGHAPVKKPTRTHNGLNINTECGYGGELTGMLIDISYPSPTLKPTFRQEKLIGFSISESGNLNH